MADRSSSPAPSGVTFHRFGALARRIADTARSLGLVVPSFRTPPSVPGVDRTLRRQPGGGVMVAVRIHGRAERAVVGDLVEGVVAANRLRGEAAAQARHTLLAAAAPRSKGGARAAA